MTPDQERRLDELQAEAVARLTEQLGLIPDQQVDAQEREPGAWPEPRRRPSPWVLRAAVAALVLVVGAAAVMALRDDRPNPPADGAEVLAQARECQSLYVEVDGWRFSNKLPAGGREAEVGAPIGEDPATSDIEPTDDPLDGWAYPPRWFGDDIPGRLHLGEAISSGDHDGLAARFVADDGAAVTLYGYPEEAQVFYQLGCAIAGEPSRIITDRYAELTADGDLPPVVGPTEPAPGFRYAGMRAEGTGVDRSVVLRFELPAQTANPDLGACMAGMPPDAPEAEEGCGPMANRAASMVLVCVTRAQGCQAPTGQVAHEVQPDPAVDGTRTYVIGEAEVVGPWAELTYTTDTALMLGAIG